MVLAEVWQGEWRLWVDGVMVDVSLGRHKDQLTAGAEGNNVKELKNNSKDKKV